MEPIDKYARYASLDRVSMDGHLVAFVGEHDGRAVCVMLETPEARVRMIHVAETFDRQRGASPGLWIDRYPGAWTNDPFWKERSWRPGDFVLELAAGESCAAELRRMGAK